MSSVCAWAANQTLSFSSEVKVEEIITYISCQVISYAWVRYLNSLIQEAESLEKVQSLFSIRERSVMEKDTWTLIMLLAPATSWSV
jgi:hypothetical protein